MTLSAGTSLGPYEILERLGAGGMGEVYRARDTDLERDIAIKVLPEGTMRDADRLVRFEREAKTIAALNHPNIVTIHGIHRDGDNRFIAMELVAGASLDRMIPAGGLSLAKIFDIAIPLTDALAAAHEQGVVHRDLKPGNVMVTRDGRVKVLDFGLAKLTSAGPASAAPDDVTMSAPLTGIGAIIGTVPYMSPEQLKGDSVDHRTDLFSIGVLLYEMASGQRPFQGEKSAEVMSSILRDTPRPLHEFNAGLPRHLGRIVAHCLEKDPEHRYQSAKDVRNELRALRKELDSGDSSSETVSTAMSTPLLPSPPSPSTSSSSALSAPTRRGEFWFGVLAVLAVLILGFWYVRESVLPDERPAEADQTHARSVAAPKAMDSLAVLPFANDSGDNELDYLSDGITETLINGFSRLNELRIIPRSTVFRHRDQSADPLAVARGLSATALLTGRVLKRADRLTIQVELTDVTQGRQLWGERYEREFADLMAIEQEIATEITGALRLRLTGEQLSKLSRGTTQDAEAYRLYLKGRYFWNKRTIPDLQRAISLFREAIDHDPNFALAWAGLADVHMVLPFYSDAPAKEEIPKARAAAEQALRIDETLAEAHSTLAYALTIQDWDWDEAERAFRRALELDPNYANTYKWYTDFLAIMGRNEEALKMIQQAAKLDPLSANIQTVWGEQLWIVGHYDEAIARFDKALEIDPAFPLTLMVKSWIVWAHGDVEEFFATRERLDSAHQVEDVPASELRRLYAAEGPEAVLRALRDTPYAWSAPVDRARWSVFLGDFDEAFRDLNRALAERDPWLPWSMTCPDFAALGSDPRYDELLAKLGLAKQGAAASR